MKWGTLVLVLVLAGCGGSRIDPPPNGEDDTSTEAASEPDSLASWARSARDAWAAGDSVTAGDQARKAFVGAWAQVADANASAHDASTTERLPEVAQDRGPSAAQVTDALTRLGLSADIREAEGGFVVWQVLVSDPVGSSTARTEFLAWPSSGAAPVVQALPKGAPSRVRYGPDAVGDLATYGTDGLASAWSRPRSRGGLEVALATRKRDGFTVTSNRMLPIEADTVQFEAGAAGKPPVLVVIGAGGRDLMFDECPTCPHLERTQRWSFDGQGWRLGEERVSLTPYAAWVSFMHAIRETGPESALPYASGPDVIEQAKAAALDLGRGPLKAAPGTTAMDATQRYRIGGSQAIEVTFSNSSGRWVVDDIRPTQIVIE
jgi:hypothetical protein